MKLLRATTCVVLPPTMLRWGTWFMLLCMALPMARPLKASDLAELTSPQPAPTSPNVDMLPAFAAPLQSAELSASVDGIIAVIDVQEGDVVIAGQRIALIDNRTALAAVELASASASATSAIKLVEIQHQRAVRQLARVEMAFDKQAASQVELEDAKSRLIESEALLQEAKERVEQARAQLELERAKLLEYEVVAPFSGVVVKVHARPGELSGRNRSIVSLANLTTLRTDLFIPLAYFGRLSTGTPIQLMAADPVNQLVEGRVSFIEPIISAATGAYRVVVHIDNRDGTLPAGFQVMWHNATRQPAVAPTTSH